MKYLKIVILSVGCLFVSDCFAQKGKTTQVSLKVADSLFQQQQWASAIPVYETILKKEGADALAWNRLAFSYHNEKLYSKAINAYFKALENKPNPALESVIQSRLAKIYSIQQNEQAAFKSLDDAINVGYRNLNELDTHEDFVFIRNLSRFTEFRKRVYNAVYPCMGNDQARQFDFWIGEWEAFVRGTNQLAGNSRIEMASGGCMILENWTSVNGPFEGKSMNFVDPVSGKWKQIWVGSGKMPNATEFFNGEYRDGAMRFEYETTDAQGNKTLTHFHFYNENPNQVRQLFKTSTDNGMTWTVGYDFTYVRKK